MSDKATKPSETTPAPAPLPKGARRTRHGNIKQNGTAPVPKNQ